MRLDRRGGTRNPVLQDKTLSSGTRSFLARKWFGEGKAKKQGSAQCRPADFSFQESIKHVPMLFLTFLEIFQKIFVGDHFFPFDLSEGLLGGYVAGGFILKPWSGKPGRSLWSV